MDLSEQRTADITCPKAKNMQSFFKLSKEIIMDSIQSFCEILFCNNYGNIIL